MQTRFSTRCCLGVQALSEAHTQVIQERELRLQHVPQPHVPLHQRHGCSAHTTVLGVDARPWQQNLREHAICDDHAAGPQGSHDAQAALALRMQHEEQASPCLRAKHVPRSAAAHKLHGVTDHSLP